MLTKEKRDKRVSKLANKVLHIRNLCRHEIKEFEKELYKFSQDTNEVSAAGYIQHKLELGAKFETEESLNDLYEYVMRTLCVDDN